MGYSYPFQSIPGVVDGGREGMLGGEPVVDADSNGAVFLHGIDAATPQKPSAHTLLLPYAPNRRHTKVKSNSTHQLTSSISGTPKHHPPP